MRTAILGAAVLVAMPIAVPVAAQDTRAQASVEASADAQLEALTDAYYRYRLDQSGRVEQADGSTARGTALPSVTAEAQLARARQAESFLSQLDALDTAQFSPEARIDAAVLRHLLETEIGDARFREWEMPFDSDSNFWGYLAWLESIPRYFSEQETNARAGLARGFSVPRVTLEGRDASLQAYVVDDPEDSPFWDAFEQIPARFSSADRERLQATAREVINTQVTPAYAGFLSFFREDYLPQTRTTLAAEEMPDGPAYYQQQIAEYTTLDLTAEQIHRIGLDEVARITAEMEAVKQEAGFDGTLPEFVTFLRTDPQFVARTPDELMGVSAYAAKRVDGVIEDYFGFLPRHRFTIRPVELPGGGGAGARSRSAIPQADLFLRLRRGLGALRRISRRRDGHLPHAL